ncbi:hypothetical protein [Psychroflexus tropicus]|uniref:hypothetical protein n=1 Tax=Psychroflexus tropicus TaxID=197345 RepID=UPI00037BA6B4|nr:hypothetical protein [Psychroflexus tropicus]
MIKHLLHSIVLISLLSTSLIGLAQQRQLKTDSLVINDSINGQVEYEYDTLKGEDVFDGKFFYQSVFTSHLESFAYEAITYEGVYISNIKEGDWSYAYKRLNPKDLKYVEDFKIGNLASGIELQVNGQFQNGKASGKWIVKSQRYNDSKVEDTLLTVRSTFKANTISGRIESKSPAIDLSGYFNADGYFHGEWEITHKTSDQPIKEVRTYEAGILKSYELEYKGKVFNLEYTNLDTSVDKEENWVDIGLQEGYFDILKLAKLEVIESISSSILFTAKKQSESTDDFITRSLSSLSFRSEHNIWQSLRGSDPIGLGKFKVRKYDFSSQEKVIIEKIETSFDNIESTLQKFKENPKLKLGKPMNEKLNQIELVYNVYSNDLSQLKTMVDVIGSDAFEYIDRTKVFDQIWPELRFPVELTYEFQSELITKTHAFPKQPEKNNFNLNKAYTLLDAIEKDVKTLNEEAKTIFQNMEAERSLSRDEEKLVSRKEQVEELFGNPDNENFNLYHERFQDLVLDLSENTFNTYGAYNLENKKDRIESVLSCFESMIKFHDFLGKLMAKDNKLDDVYTRTTFNPYVMVDMSERIKESLYQAFVDILQPYLLNKLENNFNCNDLGLAMNEMNKAYQKMLDLSNQDTRGIEKDLRRENDPQRILSLLELQSQY